MVQTFQSVQVYDTLPSCLKDSVKGFLQKVLLRTGVTPTVEDPVEFRNQGVVSTLLRNVAHKNLPLLGRDETMNLVLSGISRACTLVDKAAVVTIPAGPGQGKSEVAARLVEDWDKFISQNNASNVGYKLEVNTWISCAITFNYRSELVDFELALSKITEVGLVYEIFISFRLIFVWLVDKSRYVDFISFMNIVLQQFRHFEQDNWMESLRLHKVVESIKILSGRSKVVVIVDESLRPLQQMALNEDQQKSVITAIAQLQREDLVVVFTNLRQSPFQHANTTESGREVISTPLNSLNTTDARKLIEQMVLMQPQFYDCFERYSSDNEFKDSILTVLARWSGGRPRLCEFAAVSIARSTTSHVTDLMYMMYKSFVDLYKTSSILLSIPREVVVLALLGVKLPSYVRCELSQRGETVDMVIARGMLSREGDNQLYQPPLLLRYFCDCVSPPLSTESVINSISGSKPLPIQGKWTEKDNNLAKEAMLLLECLFPSGDGKQFENIDRIKFRVLRVARSQLLDDVRSGAIKMEVQTMGETNSYQVAVCAVKNGRLHCDDNVEFDKHDVDWRNASLEDYYGPFKFNKLNNPHCAARFDFSQPFDGADFLFDNDTFPKYCTILADVSTYINRQFVPIDEKNAGFDWFAVHVDIVTNDLVAVATEAKFSYRLKSDSNKIDPDEDIVKKFDATIETFKKSGWPPSQVVFRLAGHRYCPNFQSKTIQKFQSNVVVCGPSELRNSHSASLLDV